MTRNLLFVMNLRAGGKLKNKEALQLALKDFCQKNSCNSKFYETTGENDQEVIRKISLEYKPNAVIAVGGDGTVNMVGELLVNSGIPMGIVPTGSANGLAHDLNIPKKIDAALEVIKDFHTHAIDTLKVNGKNCFHVSDFGFNARVVRRFSESIMRGKLSYLWFGLQEFFTFNPFNYQIETDGQTIQGEAFMMTATNSNRFGTNVNINPLGEIDDGLFEISIIKPFPKFRSLEILYHLFNNTIHKTRYNQVVKCRKAIIYNKQKASFHIDGEPVVLGEKIEISIVPKGIRIILPCCR
ncbi:MAG: diacylglycerol kinase family lipid kinase [Cytophagaceae bacterium]|nr:diacylglycerol kinase family lipid kinase [Cytophagaceae bacterium]